jgi:hypothetical protein
MSKHFFVLSLIAGGLAVGGVAQVGCGGGGTGGTGTGGTGGGSLTTSVHTTASSTGTGGGTTTNHTFATAAPLTIGAVPVMATLVNTSTPDFYTFTGTKGQMLVLGTVAEATGTNMNTFDKTIIDTALTLYDSTMTQIAANNDGWPTDSTDSQLYVQLPSTGTYYVQMADCNYYAKTHTEVQCNDVPATGVTTFAYEIFALLTNKSGFPESNAGTSQDGTTANAVPITYKVPQGATAGEYGYYVLDGDFASTTSTHVFSFTPPTATKVETGARARAEFFVQPIGSDDGDGSTSNIKIWATDMTGTTIVAQVNNLSAYTTGDTEPSDNSGPLDFSFPVVLGSPYFLFVQSTASSSTPATDYYFIQHTVGQAFIGTAELEGPTGQGMDDTYQTAQALAAPNPANPGVFAADGDISAPATATKPDIDYYKMTVPATASGGYIGCDVDRVGSGLGGFTAQLFDMTGTNQLGSTIGPETANPTMGFNNYTSSTGIAVTGGQAVYLRLAAATQSATNTGTAYRCFLQFQ